MYVLRCVYISHTKNTEVKIITSQTPPHSPSLPSLCRIRQLREVAGETVLRAPEERLLAQEGEGVGGESASGGTGVSC